MIASSPLKKENILMKKNKRIVVGILALSSLIYTCKVTQNALKRDTNGKIIVNTNPSPAYLSPEESMKTIHLQKGYHLELVASEPMVHEPVAIVWDGNGRMYVAEMNTYMQDVDGTGEMKAVCSVKRLEDTNGDGKMDKSVIFIDNLVLPRMILTLDDRLLVNETNSNNIYSYRDTNGDGVADEKKLVFNNDAINTGNLEHQKSGLIWNIDNKIYVTVENARYSYDNGQIKREFLPEGPGGQWGLTNDDYGRLYFSAAGSETPALSFQQNPAYGRLDFKDQFNDEFQAVWPIISTPDVQGGVSRLRPDSTLNHFTGCTGQSIFRGTALPEDTKGDLFICEPVGRLIRRAKVTNTAGKVTLTNAYNKEEFIASTDMNFRPVNSVTGPDGSLYIVDMYRGIIQEGNWTKPGSFLRSKIVPRGLDKNIGRGRIYRVVYDGIKPDKKRPQMLNQPSSELVGYLEHANGWWRDNAQKLLVVRADKSVVPALKTMATGSQNPIARIHALWTLNGLKSLDEQTLNKGLKDKDASVRKTAVWISDDKLREGNTNLLTALEPLKNDPSEDVRFQLALSLRYSKSEKAKALLAEVLAINKTIPVLVESQKKYQSAIDAKAATERNAKLMVEADRKLVTEGGLIFKQLCATCHGADGKGVSIGGKDMPAPPLASSKDVIGDPQKLIKILLHGLSGPINAKTYPDVMPALGFNTDDYIASVLSYIRNDLGNKASTIKAADVKKVRDLHASRTKPWTLTELESSK
jgi:glucose/arabinose dehydrogenase/mono/diheme cytochrome c family protein